MERKKWDEDKKLAVGAFSFNRPELRQKIERALSLETQEILLMLMEFIGREVDL
jgi:hypothetical protein